MDFYYTKSTIIPLIILYLELTVMCNKTKPKDNQPLWSWQCENNKCVPKSARYIQQQPQSLMTCNMLCSTIPIWPYPTGSVNVSQNAIRLNLRSIGLKVNGESLSDEVLKKGLAFWKYEIIRYLPLPWVKACKTFYNSDKFPIFYSPTRLEPRNVDNEDYWLRKEHSYGFIFDIYFNDPDIPHHLAEPILSGQSYRFTMQPFDKFAYVNISTISVHGLFNALKTILQLVWYDEYANEYFTYDRAMVKDAPCFVYRGLMIDTTINYYELPQMVYLIITMGLCKLNVFHWRIGVDEVEMLLTGKVSDSIYKKTETLSQNDIYAIVLIALVLDVRVVFEFSPKVGDAFNRNSFSMYGDLVHCMEIEPELCNEPPCGQINPYNNYIYELIDKLYKNISYSVNSYVRDIVHIGGRDFIEACWKRNFPNNSPLDIWLHYIGNSLGAIHPLTEYNSHELNPILPDETIIWSSRYTKEASKELYKLNSKIIIQETDSNHHVQNFRTIFSHDPWVFKTGTGKWYEIQNSQKYNSWQQVYEHRPWENKYRNKIMGGEAIVWPSNIGRRGLMGHVWPRAAALAERLWSDKDEGATESVAARLDVQMQRFRLFDNFTSEPIWSMWCTQNPRTCV